MEGRAQRVLQASTKLQQAMEIVRPVARASTVLLQDNPLKHRAHLVRLTDRLRRLRVPIIQHVHCCVLRVQRALMEGRAHFATPESSRKT